MTSNAAELDRYLVAERAYNAAKAEGKTEDQALAAARDAVRAKREEQFLSSLGIDAPRDGAA